MSPPNTSRYRKLRRKASLAKSATETCGQNTASQGIVGALLGYSNLKSNLLLEYCPEEFHETANAVA
jgi:hypothetical protein